MAETVDIPDKVYFKIGEVARLLKVEAYVLRYWESEFPQIKPVRASSRQRLYRRQDVETLLEIKRLLYDEKFTIAGAKKRIGARSKPRPSDDSAQTMEFLHSIRTTLQEIKDLLKNKQT